MTQIITAAAVKSNTGLDRNVEDKTITTFINPAQLTLKKITGATGYDLIVAAYPLFTGEAALGTLYNDYILPFLSWKVVELAGTRMYAQPDRSGTHHRADETYRSVDSKMLSMTKADARDLTELYMGELITYLDDNKDTFTWYAPTTGSITRPNTGGVITRIDRFQRPYGEQYDITDPDCCDGY